MNQFSLKGKIALVTGASYGIGFAIASAMGEAGAKIVFNDRKPELIEKGVAAYKELGIEAHGYICDVTDEQAVQSMVAQVEKEVGVIDILVNNAGIILRNPCLEYTEADWDATMNVNLKSLFFLTQEVGKVFFRQGSGGKVINTCSMLAYQGGFTVPAYAASKAGIHALTQAFCNEWARHGINVNGIAPGYMATRINDTLQADPVRGPQISDRIPAGRWGTPEDLGGACVFLASSASDYVHGFTLAVDGGWLAR